MPKNKSPEVQQGARDHIYWFFSMDYADRRQYSENIARDILPNYPPANPSVWTW